MVMQRYPRKQERARQKRINHSEKIIEVMEEDKILESPTIKENPTARITTKIATQSRRTATGTGFVFNMLTKIALKLPLTQANSAIPTPSR